jgi:hypothetical protein
VSFLSPKNQLQCSSIKARPGELRDYDDSRSRSSSVVEALCLSSFHPRNPEPRSSTEARPRELQDYGDSRSRNNSVIGSSCHVCFSPRPWIMWQDRDDGQLLLHALTQALMSFPAFLLPGLVSLPFPPCLLEPPHLLRKSLPLRATVCPAFSNLSFSALATSRAFFSLASRLASASCAFLTVSSVY